MSLRPILALTLFAAVPALALDSPPPAAKKAAATKVLTLSAAEQIAAFRAAGFKRIRGQWRVCADDDTPSYSPGALEQVADLNGDGLPEAVLTEGGSFCYGNTGAAFWLVSKQKGGVWKLLFNSTGMAEFLKLRGAAGWPDISVGGPGFCFPVYRWNGKAYLLHRNEYQGKRCRR